MSRAFVFDDLGFDDLGEPERAFGKMEQNRETMLSGSPTRADAQKRIGARPHAVHIRILPLFFDKIKEIFTKL